MKKILCCILSAVLCFGSFSVFADDGAKLTFYSQNIKTAPNEDFTLEVNIKDNPGIANFFAILEYDTELLDLTSETESERCDFSKSIFKDGATFANENYDENQACAILIYGDNISDDGNLFSFRFSAKDKTADTKIKVIIKETGRFEDTYELYDAYDLFSYSEPQFEVSVSIGTDSVFAEDSSISLEYVDDKKFADSYKAPEKPKPNWIGVTDPTTSGDLNVEAVKKSSTTAYMAPESDTAFAPDRYLTRYETASALANIFEIKNTKDQNNFTDVSDEYVKIVNDLEQADIISGYGTAENENEKLFKGDLNVTRAEFVKLMTDAFKITAPENTADTFSDISSHWAKDYINTFAGAGYIYGYSDNTFKPDNNITRAEAVTIINNLLDISPVAASDEVRTFSDLPESHWAYKIILASFK